MKTLVIDASVAAKWFLPEEGSEHAKAILNPAHALIAPDLLWVEVAQVAWKLARRGVLVADEAERIVHDMQSFPVEPFEAGTLLPDAIRLALEHGRTVYDCLYLALAIALDSVVVTADERFVNALAAGSLAHRVNQLGAST